MKSKMNRMDPDVPFLSNLVGGNVTVDAPGGVLYGTDDLDIYAVAIDPPIRTYGAGSGAGKTVTVDTGPARVKLKNGSA